MKKKLLDVSLVLSVISLTLTLIVNIRIAKEYLRVDGKTQALFGIKEVLQFGYQYYVAVPALLSVVLAMIGRGKGHKKYIAIILGLTALLIVFLRMWRLFV